MINKLEFECFTEVWRTMSHSTVHDVRLMIDEDTDLYKELSMYTQEDGIKFKITLERIEEE